MQQPTDTLDTSVTFHVYMRSHLVLVAMNTLSTHLSSLHRKCAAAGQVRQWLRHAQGNRRAADDDVN